MAYRLNGIGTTFSGRRDFHSDGSFVTTEWVRFVYFPLIPLRSLRVRCHGPGEQRFRIGIGSSDNYAAYERTTHNGRQVLYTYGYCSFVLGWILCVMRLCVNTADATLASAFLFIGIVMPVPIPWLMMLYAKRRLRA